MADKDIELRELLRQQYKKQIQYSLLLVQLVVSWIFFGVVVYFLLNNKSVLNTKFLCLMLLWQVIILETVHYKT